MTDNSYHSLKFFFFSCGGFFGGYKKMNIETDNGNSVLCITPSRLTRKAEIKKELSADEWESFSDSIMSKFRLFDWKDKYINHDILDGTQWHIKIEYIDGTLKEVFGSNDYPDNWGEFIRFINEFVSFSGIKF